MRGWQWKACSDRVAAKGRQWHENNGGERVTGRQWRAESDRGQLRAGVKLLRPTVFLSVLQAVTGDSLGQVMTG